MNEISRTTPASEVVRPIVTQSAEPDGFEDEIDLLDYLVVLVRYRRFIVATAFCCAGLALLFSLTRKAVFKAQAKVLIEHPLDLTETPKPEEQPLKPLFFDILTSDVVLQEVAKKKYTYIKANQTVSGDLLQIFNAKNLQDACQALRSCSKIIVTGDIITLEITTQSPALSTQIADEYIQQLKKFVATRNERLYEVKRTYIEGRITDIQKKLESSKTKLVEFLAQNQNLFQEHTQSSLNLDLESTRNDLEQNITILSSLLGSLTKEQELTNIEFQRQNFVVTTLDFPAPQAASSWSRSPKKSMLIGGLCGLMIAAFLAFLLEFFRKSYEDARLDYIVTELSRPKIGAYCFRMIIGAPKPS